MIVTSTETSDNAAPPGVGRVLRNIAETAAFFDKSEATVRKWIGQGCPVEQEGGHGRSYVLDIRKVNAWRTEQRSAAEAQAAADAAAEEALRLELLGDDSVTQQRAPNDPRRQADWLKAEKEATQLAELRRELVRIGVVIKTIRGANAVLRATVLSVPDQIQHLHGLDDKVIDDLFTALTAALDQAANDIRALDIAV